MFKIRPIEETLNIFLFKYVDYINYLFSIINSQVYLEPVEDGIIWIIKNSNEFKKIFQRLSSKNSIKKNNYNNNNKKKVKINNNQNENNESINFIKYKNTDLEIKREIIKKLKNKPPPYHIEITCITHPSEILVPYFVKYFSYINSQIRVKTISKYIIDINFTTIGALIDYINYLKLRKEFIAEIN